MKSRILTLSSLPSSQRSRLAVAYEVYTHGRRRCRSLRTVRIVSASRSSSSRAGSVREADHPQGAEEAC